MTCFFKLGWRRFCWVSLGSQWGFRYWELRWRLQPADGIAPNSADAAVVDTAVAEK